MAVERTFSIIKPDATRRNLTGKINARFEEAGLRIVAQKRIWMSRAAGRGVLRRAQGAAVLQRPLHFHDLRPGRGAGARRRERRSPRTARSWAPPTRPTPRPAPSARTSPSRSRPTRCTARTARERGDRDRLLLRRHRDRRLSAFTRAGGRLQRLRRGAHEPDARTSAADKTASDEWRARSPSAHDGEGEPAARSCRRRPGRTDRKPTCGDEAERHRREQQHRPRGIVNITQLVEARVGVEMGAVLGVARFSHWSPR